jgi:DNA-binding MarR family transcriptional regulator
MDNIIRVEHDRDRPYVMVSKDTARDLSSDLQALGLLVELLCKPDDWRILPVELGKELGIGRTTIYAILGRLIEAKYIKRIDVTRRKPHGHFERRTHYVVFETKAQAVMFTAKDEQVADAGDYQVAGQVIPF